VILHTSPAILNEIARYLRLTVLTRRLAEIEGTVATVPAPQVREDLHSRFWQSCEYFGLSDAMQGAPLGTGPGSY